jgi:A/G-specific adenine glycosylase
VLILQREDKSVLLEKRPAAGIWGGLWTFPQFETRESIANWMRAQSVDDAVGHSTEACEEFPPYSHAFTHFDLTLRPLRIQHESKMIQDTDRYFWFHPQRPAAIGLAKPALDLISVCFAPTPRQTALFR